MLSYILLTCNNIYSLFFIAYAYVFLPHPPKPNTFQNFLISGEYHSLQLPTVLLAVIILRTTSEINNPFLFVQSRRVVWTKFYVLLKLKLNSVALVRTRTILTEWPPQVGEVSANFCG